MKALSIKQPWADLIVFGEKRIENRGWAPRGPNKMRGELFAIHASKADDPNLAGWEARVRLPGQPRRMAIIGVARFKEVLTSLAEASAKGQAEWWAGQRCAFLLTDVMALPKPIESVQGALNFWRLPANLERQVLEQLPADDQRKP